MGMVNKNAPPQWLSTHPSGSSRIEEIRRHLPEVMPLYAKAKSAQLSALPPYQPNVKGISLSPILKTTIKIVYQIIFLKAQLIRHL
jgi:hypothetical protein